MDRSANRPEHRPAAITLDGLGKVYPDGTVAVGDLSLEIRAGEVVVLIGPSGCGKSTVLRMINRLIEPSRGRVLVDGEDVRSADPVELRRRIGYVIQSVGLFPHQTVRANVATVPRLLGWDRRETADRTARMLDLVGLDAERLGDRYPHELSGGQRQRVGVARALAADPVLLLMDEPFSAVDPIARARLQDEFLRMRQAVGTTTVVVTHDLDEAIRLADRIAVLADHATLQQYARPGQLLAAPDNPFVATFVGADRGIKRLAVTPIPTDLPDLRSADRAAGPNGTRPGDWPTVAASGTLRDALAAMLGAGAPGVVVRDGDAPVGTLTAGDIVAALSAAAPPVAGAPGVVGGPGR